MLSDAAEGEWVGRAGMNAVVAHLLDGLAPQWSAAVASLDLMEDAWHALGADGEVLATAPCVVLAVPAPQARAMLASTSISRSDPRRAAAFAGMLEALDGASYTPCWAGIISTNPAAYAGPIAPRLRPSGEVAALIAHESAKPSRAPGHWVLHATADWSTRHLELSADELALPLRDAFCSATGIPPAEVLSVVPHRWRYALPRVGVAHSGLPACGLHLAGDIIGWQAEALIPPAEHAWTSGLAAAGAVIRRRVAQPKS